MTKTLLSVFVVALTLTSAVLGGEVDTAQTVRQPQLSPAHAKALGEALEARDAKRWPEVVDKAQRVLASGSRTPDDTFAAHGLMLAAHLATKDVSGMRVALRGIIESGFLSQAQLTPYIEALEAIGARTPTQ